MLLAEGLLLATTGAALGLLLAVWAVRTFVTLAPDDIPRVAESGLETPAQAAEVAGLGYRAALVGTALMRSDDPAELVADMRAAGCARVAA